MPEMRVKPIQTRLLAKSIGCRSNLARLPAALAVVLAIAFAFVLGGAVRADASEPASKPNQKTILFIGDSLTAGFGVKKEEAFPERTGELLKQKGHPVKIINGGISGSVSAEADRRLKWYLKMKPDILVLALGSNDALKGTPPNVIKGNLGKAIDLAKENGITVVLAGARIFTNFGPEYSKNLEAMYRDLASEKKVKFMPFLLEDVALKRELNQADGKHPNAKGHEVIAENLTRYLEPLL